MSALLSSPAQQMHELEELRKDAALYHRVMQLLRNAKLPHGQCQPRSRRACAHCNAVDDLAKLEAEYKGARIVAQG